MDGDWSDSIVVTRPSDEPLLSEDLTELLRRATTLDPDTTPSMVLQMDEVSYVNSSNLAQLLRLRAHLLQFNRLLTLCGVTSKVWTTMQMTGLDTILRFAPDTVTAIAATQLHNNAQGGPAPAS